MYLEYNIGGSTQTDDYPNNPPSNFDIYAGNTRSGVINYGGDEDVIRFTPTVSGTYSFYTSSSIDTYGYLYNSSYSVIAQNDDGGGSLQFKTIIN